MNFWEFSHIIGLRSFDLQMILRLIVASLCGAFIGIEREKKGSAAGLKTFSAVCLGAAMAMVANEYLLTYITDGFGDAARMGAQVVNGIGFLGAGTIMVTGSDKIKGLTTAATLWVTATIGLAIGSGFFFGGIAGTIVLAIATKVYKRVDYLLAVKNPKMIVCVDGNEFEFMHPLVDYFKSSNIKVVSLVRKPELRWFKNDTCMVIEILLPKRQFHNEIISEIRKVKGVLFCEEIYR